jgi:hypothetical protein
MTAFDTIVAPHSIEVILHLATPSKNLRIPQYTVDDIFISDVTIRVVITVDVCSVTGVVALRHDHSLLTLVKETLKMLVQVADGVISTGLHCLCRHFCGDVGAMLMRCCYDADAMLR